MRKRGNDGLLIRKEVGKGNNIGETTITGLIGLERPTLKVNIREVGEEAKGVFKEKLGGPTCVFGEWQKGKCSFRDVGLDQGPNVERLIKGRSLLNPNTFTKKEIEKFIYDHKERQMQGSGG